MNAVRASRADDAARLLAIWGDAVDATHHFLAPGDRSAIAGHLAIYVETTSLLVLERDGVVVGFLGQTDDHVDTLFVDPAAHGRGVGRALMTASAGTSVDVNEANGAAIGFYETLGFRAVGRSPADDRGRPYPLLHLRRAATSKSTRDRLYGNRTPIAVAGAIPIRPPMMRRPNQAPPMNGPRFNEWIQSPKVRVIDHEGENLGVMYTREAMAQAQELGLDLVEVSPNADPPVAKFLDVGKFKYEAQKKANLARKSQKTQEIKEIKMRPNIDDHDYDTKMKKVEEFIGEGDKVKVTMRFRGRELSHGQLGMAVLQRVAEQVNEVAKVEAYPRMEGRQMLMVLAPK